MNSKILNEIQIIPVKPCNGLIAFCSFVLHQEICLSSIAIYTKPEGNYRLVYPTKKVGKQSISLFYPINKKIGDQILGEVIKVFEDVVIIKNGRYDSSNNSTKELYNFGS